MVGHIPHIVVIPVEYIDTGQRPYLPVLIQQFPKLIAQDTTGYSGLWTFRLLKTNS